MFNSNPIKARLLRYCELSLSTLTLLKNWMHQIGFNGFDVENFSAPSLRVAVAENAEGDIVNITTIETIMVARGFVVSPTATATEGQQAGNTIDAVVANEAQRAGVSKLLIVVPAHHPKLKEEKWLRVVERKVSQPVAMGVGYESTPALKFFN